MTIIINKQEELEALIDKKNNGYEIIINDDLEINCDVKLTLNNDLISSVVADNITVYGNIVADDITVYGNIITDDITGYRNFTIKYDNSEPYNSIIKAVFKAKNIIINGNFKAYNIYVNKTIEYTK